MPLDYVGEVQKGNSFEKNPKNPLLKALLNDLRPVTYELITDETPTCETPMKTPSLFDRLTLDTLISWNVATGLLFQAAYAAHYLLVALHFPAQFTIPYIDLLSRIYLILALTDTQGFDTYTDLLDGARSSRAHFETLISKITTILLPTAFITAFIASFTLASFTHTITLGLLLFSEGLRIGLRPLLHGLGLGRTTVLSDQGASYGYFAGLTLLAFAHHSQELTHHTSQLFLDHALILFTLSSMIATGRFCFILRAFYKTLDDTPYNNQSDNNHSKNSISTSEPDSLRLTLRAQLWILHAPQHIISSNTLTPLFISFGRESTALTFKIIGTCITAAKGVIHQSIILSAPFILSHKKDKAELSKFEQYLWKRALSLFGKIIGFTVVIFASKSLYSLTQALESGETNGAFFELQATLFLVLILITTAFFNQVLLIYERFEKLRRRYTHLIILRLVQLAIYGILIWHLYETHSHSFVFACART